MSANTNPVITKETIAQCRTEGKCIDCREPFKMGVNVFSEAGKRETAISGICEQCFDANFADAEE